MISKLRVIHNGQIVGHLAENKGEIRFEYTQNWLANGFDLAPGIMPFNGDANEAPSQVFDGLHGAFNDSLPDGWGLLLMDRALKKHKDLDPSQITPLDRLAYMWHRSMGALEYKPELLPEQESNDVDLADMAAKSEIILQGETTEILEAVRLCGGSPGGARPKVTVAFSEDMKSCISNFGILPEGYSHWIVKFRNDNRYGNGDPVDIGRQEIAYAEMARAAGLQFPKTHLVEL